ncbi:hypothetical protein AX16_008663 [Volvariella volvacea WC 439]|nr:hypothetical protein AX16_008663 [Volvariella volvacea WC 439]
MPSHSTAAGKGVTLDISDSLDYDKEPLLLLPPPLSSLPPPSPSTQHQQLELEQEDGMGREEQYLKREGRPGDDLLRYIALGSISIIVLATWALILSNISVGFGWFALHPPLQVLALGCFTYGILTLQPTSQPKTKAAGFKRHQAAILFIGVPSIIVGTSAISYNKWLNGKDHYTTWHGRLGILAVTWLVFQVLIGGGSVWFGGAAFGGGTKAKAVWKYHRLSGYLLFPLFLFTTHLGGVWSGWASTYANAFLRTVAFTLAPVALVIAIWARARTSKMNFSQ